MNKKLIAKLALPLTLFSALYLGEGHHINVSASKKANLEYISTYPKSIRGTWYTYYHSQPSYEKIVITKDKIYDYLNTKGFSENKKPSVTQLHKFYKHTDKSSYHPNWVYSHGWYNMPSDKLRKRWLYTYGWNQSAGTGTFYNISKIQGNWILSRASGAGFSSSHAYRSENLAKKLANKKYSGFIYD